MSVASSTATALSAVLVLVSACREQSKFRYETEHLRISTFFDAPLCRGDLDHLERVVTRLETDLDTSIEQPLEIHLWAAEMWPNNPGWCADEHAIGCFDGEVIHAQQLSVAHEIVHALVATLGSPAPFWSEGAAESRQTDRTAFGDIDPSASLSLDTSQLDRRTAAHFSRWLIDVHGIERFRELLRSTGSGKEAFEATYGMSVQEAEASYLSDAPHSFAAWITCEHPLLAADGDSGWSETIVLACDQPAVYGGSLGMAVARVLEIDARGLYDVSTLASSVTIASCKDQDVPVALDPSDPSLGDIPPINEVFTQQVVRLLDGGGESNVLDLAPGRYEIVAGFPDHEPRDIWIDVVPSG